jgi:hypothetical protein
VIEIPPIDHLDASLKHDLKFYARFLAIYVCKMKRDKVHKDQCYQGENFKSEIEEWSEKLREKYWRNECKWIMRRENSSKLDMQGYENFTSLYHKKKNVMIAKKRRKKEKSLWLKTIQLDSYISKLFIYKKAVLEHRISRYKSEEDFFQKFGYIIIRNTQIKPIIKDEMKLCYSEPY